MSAARVGIAFVLYSGCRREKGQGPDAHLYPYPTPAPSTGYLVPVGVLPQTRDVPVQGDPPPVWMRHRLFWWSLCRYR